MSNRNIRKIDAVCGELHFRQVRQVSPHSAAKINHSWARGKRSYVPEGIECQSLSQTGCNETDEVLIWPEQGVLMLAIRMIPNGCNISGLNSMTLNVVKGRGDD